MLNLHTMEHGYQEVEPPVLVRDDAMFGTAQLPKFFADQYFASGGASQEALEQARLVNTWQGAIDYIEKNGFDKFRDVASRRALAFVDWKLSEDWNRLWLIPTAEVSMTNLVRESIVDEKALPPRFMPARSASAPRRERRARMIRQHQFQKVELVSITTLEQARDEHDRMTACAEEVLKRLGLHFRTVVLCAGDTGFASRKTYDIEVWLPGQGRFREISSCSLCADFQARRMNARFKAADAKATRFVHPERLRRRGRPGAGGGDGELSAAGRIDRDPGRSAGLHGRADPTLEYTR